jgi:tRNA/rRNA methyltransferase
VNDKPVIILVRPQLGQNIGKAARAMLNFGLTELRLVAPRDGWPNPEAGPAASGADVVLEQAKVFDTAAEAIADCSQVFASTVRRRDLVMPAIGPEEMAGRITASAQRSAILFGPERSGLETEEVALANAIVTVPINPEFASLNLAQAVILLAYEWSKCSELAQPPVKELEAPAPHGELEGLIGQLDGELVAKGYFHPPSRTQATRNTIRTIFTKAGAGIDRTNPLQHKKLSVIGGFSMSLIVAALLIFAQAADQPPPAPAQGSAAAAAPKKLKKICKLDDLTSGSRMAKRICLTEEEWAQHSQGMTQSARAGFSGKAEDH